MTILSALAWTSAAAWLFLLLGRSGFWRADQRLPKKIEPLAAWPDVIAIIPARNEAETIADVVSAHRETDYPGAFQLIVVDDNSDDDTAMLALQAGGDHVAVISAPPLASGWSGKLWALNAGLAHAEQIAKNAAYVLLTDADIRHAPTTLRRLVALAETHNLALVSLMARLDVRGQAARLLIPAFVFFFQKLYPFRAVNRPDSAVAGAAGGCVLLRRRVLREIGGVAAIRGALIDDCALAAAVKRGPPRRPIWLGLANDEVVSLRDNQAFGSIWSMVSRTAFTQLRYSTALLLGTVVGMAFLYLASPATISLGFALGDLWALSGGFVGMILIAIAYMPTLTLYGEPRWRAVLLPLAAALYSAMTIGSALQHWRGRGGRWKGRSYQ